KGTSYLRATLFFFQAEDGIRDGHVTGVQTCALPIYRGDGTFADVTSGSGLDHTGWGMGVCAGDFDNDGYDDLYVTYYGGNVLYRSEERRVGKEEKNRVAGDVQQKEQINEINVHQSEL